MRTTITLKSEKIVELLEETKVKSKSKAVAVAIDDFLKRKRIEKIKLMKGMLDFDLTADEIRHYER